jgi:hypothetical protein
MLKSSQGKLEASELAFSPRTKLVKLKLTLSYSRTEPMVRSRISTSCPNSQTTARVHVGNISLPITNSTSIGEQHRQCKSPLSCPI